MTTPQTVVRSASAPRTVEAAVNYVRDVGGKRCYYANDSSRDVLSLDVRSIRIEDARSRSLAPSLRHDGFELLAHSSSVADFRNQDAVATIYPREIERLITELTGADRAVVSSPGVLRFSETSPDSGRHNNSRPARFIHVDVSNPTAAAFAERSRPKDDARRVRRFAHYNIWRVLSPPPQDVPLAVCDARSIEPRDLLTADAIFDNPGQPEWSFEGLVVSFNPGHRWSYFSGMTRAEALVFKTHDSDPVEPSQVPHTAFNDPACPAGVPPRTSIEMRAIGYWFE